jgi:triphosphatase
MPNQPREIELKLIVDRDGIAALEAAPLVAAHASGRPAVRNLDATYYDTEDRSLQRAGLSLRVRADGRRYIQTLKSAPAEDNPMHRGEWEVPVPSMAPLPAAHSEILPEPLRTLRPDDLRPMFTTAVRRRQRLLAFADASIEIAFDRGVIEAGERTLPLCEVELELKSGSPASLYEAALQLFDHHPFRLGVESKAARGYALACNCLPPVVKAPPITLDSHTPIGETFGGILRATHAQVLGNQAAVENGSDPEGVHQIRVGLRRLRSALSLMIRQ